MAKNYLMEASYIDQRINAKIEQVSSLHDLATKANTTLSDMPGCPNRNIHRMEDVIVKIVDLENEINGDIDRLVELKTEITHKVRKIPNPDWQMVIERRYLTFTTWEHIADDMHYSVQHVFRLHEKALTEFAAMLEDSTEG